MDCKSLLLITLSLIVGGLGGWLLRAPDSTIDQIERSRPTPRPERERKNRSASTTAKYSEYREEIEHLKVLRASISIEEISKLSRSEKETLVHALSQLVNPDQGLDWEDRKLLDTLMQSLLEEQSPEELALWAEQQFTKGVRAYLLRNISNHLIKSDFDTGIQFAANHLDDEEMDTFAGKLFIHGNETTVNTHQAITFLEYLKAGSRSSGSSTNFSDDFDFQKFSELAVEKKGDHRNLSHFPTNLFTEWAKRDIEGAMAFYDKYYLEDQQQLPMNDFGNIVEGYVGSVPASESATWLADILLADDLPQKTRAPLLGQLSTGNLSEHIRGEVFANLTDPADQAHLASELYLHLEGYSGGSIPEERSELLGLFPSPEARMDFLQNDFQSGSPHLRTDINDSVDYRLNDLASHLRVLGHTEAEIQSVTEKLTEQP